MRRSKARKLDRTTTSGVPSCRKVFWREREREEGGGDSQTASASRLIPLPIYIKLARELWA